jgi:hypothetical protein
MNTNQLKEYNKAQAFEILESYGRECADLWSGLTIDEYAQMWISLRGFDFRKEWENRIVHG